MPANTSNMQKIGFPLLFTVAGLLLSCLLVAFTSCCAAAAGFTIAYFFRLLEDNHLEQLTWILLPLFALFWLPLNYFVGRVYISKPSKLARSKQIAASYYLGAAGFIVWTTLFFLQILNMPHETLSQYASFIVPAGCPLNLTGQLIAIGQLRKTTNTVKEN